MAFYGVGRAKVVKVDAGLSGQRLAQDGGAAMDQLVAGQRQDGRYRLVGALTQW